MSVRNILRSENLINFNEATKYVPFVSTAVSLADLFLKYVVIPCLAPATVLQNRYYQHIQNKEDKRILWLLIPFIGNFVVIRMDRQAAVRAATAATLTTGILNLLIQEIQEKESIKENLLNEVNSGVLNGPVLKNIPREYREDANFMLDLIKIHYEAFNIASDKLKKDPNFILDAAKANQSRNYIIPLLENDKALATRFVKEVVYQAETPSQDEIDLEVARIVKDAPEVHRLIKLLENKPETTRH